MKTRRSIHALGFGTALLVSSTLGFAAAATPATPATKPTAIMTKPAEIPAAVTAGFKTAAAGGKVSGVHRVEGKTGAYYVGQVTGADGKSHELRLDATGKAIAVETVAHKP